MDTKDDAALCDALSDEADALAHDIMGQVAGKWPMWVLFVLCDADAPLRFSRIREQVEGISQKVLTQTLRQLERDGFITRTVYAQVPPRVDYALTELGRALPVQVMPLWRWVIEHTEVFAAARRRFDAAKLENT